MADLVQISRMCHIVDNPPLYRAAFLVAYFAFLHMSNFTPHSQKAFDPTRHLLRQDMIFAPQGVHVLLKWTKKL